MSKNYRGNRGYVVTPELRDNLLDQLRTRGIEFRVVDAPEGLGEYPRPVLVTTGPKPDGWVRYGTCRKCGGMMELGAGGMVSTGCPICEARFATSLTASKLWDHIEHGTRSEALQLPAWFTAVDAPTVFDVRRRLAERELPSIGPEREVIVSQALTDFRNRVVALLKESL
jgi:hypothetical protein